MTLSIFNTSVFSLMFELNFIKVVVLMFPILHRIFNCLITLCNGLRVCFSNTFSWPTFWYLLDNEELVLAWIIGSIWNWKPHILLILWDRFWFVHNQILVLCPIPSGSFPSPQIYLYICSPSDPIFCPWFAVSFLSPHRLHLPFCIMGMTLTFYFVFSQFLFYFL